MTLVEELVSVLAPLVGGRVFASAHDVPDDCPAPYLVVAERVTTVPGLRGDRTVPVWEDTARVHVWQRADQFDDLLCGQVISALLTHRVSGPSARWVPVSVVRVDDPDEPWTQEVVTLRAARTV